MHEIGCVRERASACAAAVGKVLVTAGQLEDTTGNLIDELWLVKGSGSGGVPASAENEKRPRRASATEQARIFDRTHACTVAGTRLPECAAL